MPPPSQSYPVPSKLTVATFPTPDNRDVYVYQHLDSKGIGFTMPQYGDPIPASGKANWPDHIVTLIVPNKELGDGWLTVVFASDRANQDAYNFSLSYPNGTDDFVQVTRTYVYERSKYLIAGPVAPGTQDPGLKADNSAQFPHCILMQAEKMSEGTGDTLIDSLFVAVSRIYEQIPRHATSADMTAAGLFGFKVETPYGLKNYPRLTWRIPIDALILLDDLSACPITGFTDLVLIGQTHENEKGIKIARLLEFEKNPGPTVYSVEYEPRTNSSVIVTKQIVAQSTVPTTPPAQTPGAIVEYQQMGMDALRSIKITSTIAASLDGSSYSYPTILHHTFPDFLNSAAWVIAMGYSVGRFALDIALKLNITQGYSGPCNAIVTEYYTYDPAGLSIPAATKLLPKADTLTCRYFSISDTQASAVARTFAVPATIHDAITITNANPVTFPFSGSIDTTIAATTPTTIPTGYIVAACDVERWKFGLWIVRVTTVKHPS